VATTERPDVEQLCRLLADGIEANGSKRPNVTQGWRDAARLLLDKDGRTSGSGRQHDRLVTARSLLAVERHVDAQSCGDKYDQMRLRALEETRNGHRPSTTDQRVAQTLAMAAELERREQDDHQG